MRLTRRVFSIRVACTEIYSMQTSLSYEFQNTPEGRQAEKILRKCVHCGFCNATCPTYELLGDELDGPRGRIYQMKQLFEGGTVSQTTRLHLDRCLMCRSCETTCPSGVQYSTLLAISKVTLDKKLPRSLLSRMHRHLLARLIVSRKVFAWLLRLGWCFTRIVPQLRIAALPPKPRKATANWPPLRHSRRMIALAGCVQSVLAPATNLAAANVLDRLGISLFEVDAVGCCGAVQLHTCDTAVAEPAGKAAARALIDQWLPHLEQGVEAIVMTASGCGLTIKEYAKLFADDPEYREKALMVCQKTVDLCELLARELPNEYTPRMPHPAGQQPLPKVAFHAPCTLQHGQQKNGVVESILARAGYTVCEVRDSHLCCGAAGTYSILQPTISAQLRRNKQSALAAAHPHVVCTANIGCQLQLGVDSPVPIVHWVELLDQVWTEQDAIHFNY